MGAVCKIDPTAKITDVGAATTLFSLKKVFAKVGKARFTDRCRFGQRGPMPKRKDFGMLQELLQPDRC